MRPEKREARRQHIIASARQLFLKFGYRKTSLEDVARQAGVGKATLYHYFDGKDALFGAVVERIYFEYLKRLKAALSASLSPLEKLRTYGSVLLDQHSRYMNSANVDRFKEDGLPAKFLKHLKGMQQAELDIIESIVEEGVTAGEFRSLTVKRVALLLHGSFKAMVSESSVYRGREEVILEEFLGILLHGLLAEES